MKPLECLCTFSRVLLIAAVAGIWGCGSDQSAYPSPETRPLPHAPAAEHEIDINALATVLPRVFADLHWGQMKIENELTALRARALTPGDRPVDVRAQETLDGVAVQAKVGYFGDAEMERRFFAALERHVEAAIRSDG